MIPSCSCLCGARLELRHAVSRKLVEQCGNWAQFRLRFRCPRCARSVTRQFEVRTIEAEAPPLEVYERVNPSSLGSIGEGESRVLLDNDGEALGQLLRESTST